MSEVTRLAEGLPGRRIVAVGADLERLRRELSPRPGGPRVLLRNTVESPAEWRAVMLSLPAEVAGFALDLGWAHRSAADHVGPAVEEPARAFLRWADRVEAVILHDATEAALNLPLGRGHIAWHDLAVALRESGVRAPLLLDVAADEAAVAQSLELARALFVSEQ